MYDMEKHCRILELDKVLALLAECCGCPQSKQRALEICPTDDYQTAVERMKLTYDASELATKYGSPSVYGIKDMTASVRRAQVGSSLSLGELLDIGRVLKAIRGVVEYRESCENTQTVLDEMFDSLTPNPELESLIFDSILSEEELADTASAELRDIRRKIRNTEVKIRDQLDKLVRSPATSKYLQEQLVTMRDGRFVVPVKSEYRSEIKGMVHDTSASGATFFIEPASVVEANNEIRILQAREREEINRIIAAMSARVGTFAPYFCESYEMLVRLDLCFAKAKLARKMRAEAPQLTKKGGICLRQARHPLIDSAKIVANDIEVGGEYDTLVVTGPNTGGKTVTIKTAGLLTLMASCGLMIPAMSTSSVCVCDAVFADIGDEQSIEQSLSTFSSHITNIIKILEDVTPNSLVLLDELGAGTDPVEGAALAIAIIERLRKIGCRTIATTHYAEIKMFALQTPGVENASCEFDVASLKPTYRLLTGVPGRSNAFAISQRLGMSDDIIARASELISNEDARFEDVVDKLEESRQELEKQLAELQADRIAAQKNLREAEETRRRIEAEKNREVEQAKAESRRIIERVNYQAQQLLDEIDEIKKQKNSENFAELAARARAQVKSGVNSMYESADPIEEKKQTYVLPRKLVSGDSVLINSLNREGIVVSPPDNSGVAVVQAGIMKMKVPVDDLRLVEKKKVTYNGKAPAGGVSKKVTSAAERSASTEIDLRGMTTEEALMDLDAFIDNCMLSGIQLITIIHGKGTGALRAAIQKHLRAHKSVRTFRLGVFGEGESGVTIAELK